MILFENSMMIGVIVIRVSMIVECVVDYDQRWMMEDEEVIAKSISIMVVELSSIHMDTDMVIQRIAVCVIY